MKRLLLASIFSSLAFVVPAHAQRAYTVQDQNVPTTSSAIYPTDINAGGAVTGYYYDASFSNYHAFIAQNGATTTLGTFGGAYTYSYAINDAGVAVGYSETSAGYQHAFVYSSGVMHDIGGFAAEGYRYATAVNNGGVVVGYADGYAFVYRNGTLTKLQDLLPANNGWTSLGAPSDINDANQITGQGYNSSIGGWRAYVITLPASGIGSITAIPTSTEAYPYKISNSGLVGGYVYGGSTTQGFLYVPGDGVHLVSLGGSYAYVQDVNDAGQAVGYGRTPDDLNSEPFIYSVAAGLQVLPALNGATGGTASHINAAGVVIGSSSEGFVYHDGTTQSARALVSACNWSYFYPQVIGPNGQLAGMAYGGGTGYRLIVASPATSQATTLTVPAQAAQYSRSVTLTGTLQAACSAISGEQIDFTLNGGPAGSAATDSNGVATLTASLGSIAAGTYPSGIGASFGGDTDLDASSATATLTVNKATPTIDWRPQGLVEGTPLGSDQLNATAETPGTFYYFQPAGTVLSAGLQQLSLQFTPADTANYFSTFVSAYVAVRASQVTTVFTSEDLGGSPFTGSGNLTVTGFNNAAQAVGYAYLPGNSSYHAFLLDHGALTDLGTLGGTYSNAAGINDDGVVVGWSYTAQNNYQRAFLYDGTMHNLGGLTPNLYDYSAATAVSNNGKIAGYARSTSGYSHPFLYAAGTMQDLGTPGGDNANGYAQFVNDAGDVAGYWYSTNTHAFLYHDGTMTDIVPAANYSTITGLNASGETVGYWSDSTGTHGFLYHDGSLTELTVAGGANVSPQAINDAGIVTGYFNPTGGGQHAFKYDNGVMTDLGVLAYSYAIPTDINNPGTIVGYGLNQQGRQVGFAVIDGVMTDLNALLNGTSNANAQNARFINDNGQILVQGVVNNVTHYFVLTPASIKTTALSVDAVQASYGATVTLTAHLTADDPSGRVVQFRIQGASVGAAQTDGSGLATLQVALGSRGAGSYIAGLGATFTGDAEYAGSTAAADLTIVKATPTVTVTGTTATYDGFSHPVASFGATGVFNEALPASITYNGVSSPPVNAGTYSAVASFAGNANYLVAQASATVTINKAVPTVAVNNATYSYDAHPHGTSGSVTGVGNAYLGAPVLTYDGLSDLPVSGGVHAVVGSFAGDTNYAAAQGTATLTITRATPVVSVTGGTFTYDGQGHAATGTVTGVGGADLGAPTLTYGGSSTAPVNAGSYAVVGSFAGDTNYASAQGTATLTIAKATPVISVTGGTFTYDAQPHGTTASAHGVLGEPLTPVTLTYDGDVAAPVAAGTHAVLASFAGSDNYAAGSSAAAIVIEKAALTVAVDSKSRVYGSANPPLTGTIAGVQGNDAIGVAYATSAVPASAVGAYPITASLSGAALANYSPQITNSVLTITAAPLMVRADDAVRQQGVPNPAFTASYSGFVLGETPSVLGGVLSFSTPATTASPVGTYPITPSGLTSSNYAIAFVNGTLTVDYGVCPLFDTSKAHKAGSTVPLKLQICGAANANLSSPAVVLNATSLRLVSGNASADVEDAGNANPDNNFRYDPTLGGYIFNLKTTGLSTGTWELTFTVSGDPLPHAVTFQIR